MSNSKNNLYFLSSLSIKALAFIASKGKSGFDICSSAQTAYCCKNLSLINAQALKKLKPADRKSLPRLFFIATIIYIMMIKFEQLKKQPLFLKHSFN